MQIERLVLLLIRAVIYRPRFAKVKLMKGSLLLTNRYSLYIKNDFDSLI